MKILQVLGNYLPGLKAGGPIRTVTNLVEQLGDEFQFNIVAANRDLGDTHPYPNIEPGKWYQVGKAQVRYLSPAEQSWVNWCHLLNELDFDLIHLHGFFLALSAKTLWWRWAKRIPNVPIIDSPSGEFAPGALAFKRYKKRPYLWLAKQLGVGQGVTWHVQSDLEAQDMLREIPFARVVNIPPLIAPAILDHSRVYSVDKCPGELKLVYLSRVTPKKNLDFALRLLRYVPAAIQFDIYGPLEDQAYWSKCQQIIRELPANVKVRYCGLVPLDQVPHVLSSYHLFLFPTRSENFSHAIFEALSAGCPVLISDQTPWRDLKAHGIGWDLPLAEPEQFCAALRQCAMMDQAEFQCYSTHALAFAADFMQHQIQADRQAYCELYWSVCGR